MIAILKYSGLWFNKKKKEVKSTWVLLNQKQFPLFSSKIGIFYLFEEENEHETCIHCGHSKDKKVDTEHNPHKPNPELSKEDKREPKQHPIYGKFFKMINMGVPKPAVQQKIVMSGLNPEIINNPKLLEWKTNKKNKKDKKHSSQPINPLFHGISLGKVNLKKTKPIKKKKILHSKLGLNVPSLDDILRAIKRLKSSKIYK